MSLALISRKIQADENLEMNPEENLVENLEEEDIKDDKIESRIIEIKTKEDHIKDRKMSYYEPQTDELEIELLEEGISLLGKSENYLWGVGGNEDEAKRILFIMNDKSDKWYPIKKFDKKIKGLHVNSKDHIFVSVANNRWENDAEGEIYLSTNEGKDFEKVLDVKSGVVLNWNMASDDEGYMYISEYGNKDEDNNPRRIYKSEDYGKNFEVVYAPEIKDGYHNHVIHIDKNNPNNIYQVVGDDDKHLLKSEDRGESWARINEGYHPTAAIQIDENIIYGLDGYPFAGFIIYNTEKDEIIEEVELPRPYRGSIYNMYELDGLIYAGVLSYNYHDWPGGLFVSDDEGRSWKLLAKWDKEEDYGVGFYDMCDWNDHIYLSFDMGVEGDGELYWHKGTLKFKKLENLDDLTEENKKEKSKDKKDKDNEKIKKDDD